MGINLSAAVVTESSNVALTDYAEHIPKPVESDYCPRETVIAERPRLRINAKRPELPDDCRSEDRKRKRPG